MRAQGRTWTAVAAGILGADRRRIRTAYEQRESTGPGPDRPDFTVIRGPMPDFIRIGALTPSP